MKKLMNLRGVKKLNANEQKAINGGLGDCTDGESYEIDCNVCVLTSCYVGNGFFHTTENCEPIE